MIQVGDFTLGDGRGGVLIFAVKFANENFEIPRVFVLDNGKQFDNNVFKDFCQQLGIKNHYSFPTHPLANG